MSRVVVVGSGFAGCTAVRTLRKNGFAGQITVVSPQPELFYYPSLVWVPAGRRTESDLRFPLPAYFQKHGVEHRPGVATGLDLDNRKLLTEGAEVAYDYLVIASGGRYIRKLPGLEHVHIGCAGWDDIKAYSDRLAALEEGVLAFGFSGNPKEPAAVRGGPVFEYLFGVDTLLRQQGRRDRFELVFFSPAEKPGVRMGEKAVERILAEVERRGIRRHLGAKLTGFEPGKVLTEKGTIAADLVLFIPGMTGPAWAQESGLKLSPGGFFQADNQCRVEGAEGIYVAGDAGSFPGPAWKPKQAHMADLQAECSANNLLAHSRGEAQTHRFKTELICIVDNLTNGTLVYRSEKHNFMMRMKPLHWAKIAFEQLYLRPYRQH